MGIASVLPVPDNTINIIESFVFRSQSLVGHCGSGGSDIANLADVGDHTIALLHDGNYNSHNLNSLLYIESLEFPINGQILWLD